MTLRRFGLGRRGAVTPIMALALIPILMAMGMAAEASNWWLTQRNLQHAADSAALAAAIDAGANACPSSSSCSQSTYAPPTSIPTATDCSGAWTIATSWYCQAKAASKNQGYQDAVDTVTVTPTAGTTSCPASLASLNGVPTGEICYKVTVTKNVPIYLLTLMGFAGNATYNGAKAQIISASAVAAAPGPPLDFCILTTNGDIGTNGTPNADIRKCSTFSNGKTTCTGQGIDSGYDYATGVANCNGGVNVSNQSAQCDPYGPTTQTIQGNSVSCPSSTNASNSIPNASCGSYNSQPVNSTTYPKANVITQASVNGTASGGYPNATSMTVGGTAMQVIQVCGDAAFGNGISGAGSTGTVSPCGSTVTYTGTTANLLIIVYNGGLSLNGCTFQNSEPTASGGGVTVVFAPPTATAGSTCPTQCTPISANSTGGELDIAAPKSGTFSGLAIMQSANYSANSGCNPSGSHSGPLDWCDAGNTPSLALQGLLYMPNGAISFSGAISKFDQPGALNCIALIIKSMLINGTGYVINNTGAANLTSGCGPAGVTLPGIPGSHTFYQALVA